MLAGNDGSIPVKSSSWIATATTINSTSPPGTPTAAKRDQF
jgi:hypothetical protein